MDEIEAAARALWQIGNERIGHREWDGMKEHYISEAAAALTAAGYERLKAENASLREELEEARNEACVRCGFPTHDIISAAVAGNASLLESLREAEKQRDAADLRGMQWASDVTAANVRAHVAEQRAEAAEKRNTELQGALRAAAAALHQVLCVGLDEGQGLSSQEKRAARVWRQVSDSEIAARAALHDEERSAPPQEKK